MSRGGEIERRQTSLESIIRILKYTKNTLKFFLKKCRLNVGDLHRSQVWLILSL